MISTTQAKQYLDQMLGITVPDFLISAAVDRVETAEAAMIDAGYDDATQVLVQSMAVALVVGGDPRRTQSQHAASGASRSFKYSDKDLTNLRRTLSALDTAGTVTSIVGPDPVSGTLLHVTC